MGCGASSERGEDVGRPARARESGQLPPELEDAYDEAKRLVEEYVKRREGHGKFLQVADQVGEEEQLLVATVCVVIYSAMEEHFKGWVEAREGNGGAVSILMSPSNVNFSTWMIRGIFETSKKIASVQANVDGSIPKEQLMNVLKFRQMWRMMMGASAVLHYTHPSLGEVPLIQPLLISLINYRGQGSGNGEGDQPDPIFDYFLSKGADPNVPNSLGIFPIMVAVANLASTLDYNEPDEFDAKRSQQNLNVIRKILAAGAKVTARTRTWGPGIRLVCNQAISLFEALLQDDRQKDFDVFDVLRAVEGGIHRSLSGSKAALIAETRSLLEHKKAEEEIETACSSLDVSIPVGRLIPWSQAMFNITYALSQVASGKTHWERIQILLFVQKTAPFPIPNLNVVSVAKLRQQSAIPKYMTSDESEGAWRPTSAQSLTERAVLVFVSHRWLGGNCPDDPHGSKFQKILLAAGEMCQKRQVAEEDMYLWLDFAVIDQANPMPSVQALPIYMACCSELLYLHHPQYWERAWCLTEQFMFWKLCRGAPKVSLTEEGKLDEESTSERPPDPSLGKMAVEAERVALSTMTAIMPYEEG